MYSTTILTGMTPTMPVEYRSADRLFAGLAGFGISKQGGKRFEFCLHASNDYSLRYTLGSGAVLFVDLSFVGMYKISCGVL